MPVYVFDVGHLNSKAITAYTKSTSASHSKMLRLFALYENLTRFIMPLCSSLSDRPNPETPITQSNNIVDIQGVGLRQFWNLKGHMQEASTLATAHYPETLDRIFIVGAPSFFPTVWGWVKRWFDPITVSKIFVLSAHNMRPTLEKFIDPANIPTKYGGQLPYEFGMGPIFDHALQQQLEWTVPGIDTFPQGPMMWVNGDGPDQVAVAVGSLNGKQRREPVATLHARSMEKMTNGHT
ncbi:MAG: hypothetical protein LQ347_006795 [Umbilicaria vellea]|nr:MAG: hypothetical protein LQ347_006795 [Umbilicaria vellea]